MTADKPLFIHLIGLEGCGHHGVFPIVEKVLRDKYGVTARPLHFRTGLRGFFNAIYYEGLPKDVVFSDLETFLHHNPGAIFVDDNSYPSAIRREPRHQWKFSEIHERAREYCDFRFVRLKRNIHNTVNSHRDWDGGLIGHARVLAAIQAFIDDQIAALADRNVRLYDLDYDNIADGAAVIADIAGCDPSSASAAIAALFMPSGKDYRDQMSENEIGQIGRLFGL